MQVEKGAGPKGTGRVSSVWQTSSTPRSIPVGTWFASLDPESEISYSLRTRSNSGTLISQMKRSLSSEAVLMAGFVAVIAFLLTGCLASLQPFYTAETLTTDDAIIGVWGDKDDATWTFSRQGEGKTYTLIVTE